jgi:hypothetical protein
VKWLADECFDNDIIRGLFRRSAGLDLIRVQDVAEIAGRDDAILLDWAAANERILLTHDLATMIPAAVLHRERVSIPARIVLVPDSLPIGEVIDQILLLDHCSDSLTGLRASSISPSANPVHQGLKAAATSPPGVRLDT